VNAESTVGLIAKETAYFITGQCAVGDMDRKEQLIQQSIDKATAFKNAEIARLKNLLSDDFQFSKLLGEANQRMAELTAMLEEAMKIFGLYLNVPESRALQERWEKLKNAP